MTISNPFGPHDDVWAYLTAASDGPDGGLLDFTVDELIAESGEQEAGPTGERATAPRVQPGSASGDGDGANGGQRDREGMALSAVVLDLLRDIAVWGPVTDEFISHLRGRQPGSRATSRGAIRNHVMELTKAGMIVSRTAGGRAWKVRFALSAGFEAAGVSEHGSIPMDRRAMMLRHLGVLSLVLSWPEWVDIFPRAVICTWPDGRDPITGRVLVHRLSSVDSEVRTWIPDAYGRFGCEAWAIVIADGQSAMDVVNDLRAVLGAVDFVKVSLVTTDIYEERRLTHHLTRAGLSSRCEVHLVRL